jgi:CDP-diacylglycerol---glycerol-3-phosphate 3-phosphatidyltransferase
MANALTAARVLLALPFAFLMARGGAGSAAFAALVLAAAIATDVLDGPIARRRGAATAAGSAFDHAADCLFVTSGLAAGAVRGVFPWILPVLVAAAFAQYLADSYWVHRGSALRPSELGRYNGILYFAPLGGDLLVRAGLRVLQPAVTVLVWMLVVSTVVSMGERLWAVRGSSRKARDSPVEERGDRPRR